MSARLSAAPAVASKVKALKEAAYAEIAKIDELGGAIEAIESGYMKAALVRSQAERLARINAGDVLTIGELAVKETKTKAFVQLVKKQTNAARVLIVSDGFDPNTYKSARNVKPVTLARASDVNTEQLLSFEKILVTDSGLAKLAERTNASASAKATA